MNLYFRLLWVFLSAQFKPRISVGDVIEMRFRVWPNDLDVNGHVNNGRYMTLVDLALTEYFSRLGLLRVMRARKWRPMLGGGMISFRRGLQPFQAYTLRFAMQCWDEKWSYMRFEFLVAGQIMAQGLTKGAVVGPRGVVNAAEVMQALGATLSSPEFPPATLAWIEAERSLKQTQGL